MSSWALFQFFRLHFFMKEPGVTFFHPRRISQKLMRIVFVIYMAITLVLTSIQFMAEYKRTQDEVLSELEVLEHTFHTALATSLWQMNEAQLEALAKGLMSMPVIVGVDIVNPSGEFILAPRDFPPEEKPLWLFSIEKSLNWTLNSNEIPLGVLKLYSSSDVIMNRVLFGFFLIALNAIVKTAFLWVLFLWAFQRFLGTPLQKLTSNIDEIDLEHVGDNKLQLGIQDENEIKSLQEQFNNMLLRIKSDRQSLIQDEENRRRWLEEEVTTRTQELQALNVKLTQLASTDALTGLCNRRVFFEQAQFQMDLSTRQSTPLCLLVLDIDNFKAINDTFGHSAGDGVLCCFADVISSRLRKTDIFGRIGGEEFAVLLIDTDLEAAALVAEKLRQSVLLSTFEYDAQEIKFSVSIGVSRYCEDDESFKDFFVRSDDLLYRAKRNGRNRVEKMPI